MTPERLLAFIGFSLVMAGTPGPSNALLTATGASVGIVRGLPALIGVAAGMAALMFSVAFGLGAVVVGVPLLATAVRWVGTAVLLWLAWKLATASSAGAKADATSRPIGFFGAAAFQWINPKSWLASTSAAAAFSASSDASPLLQGATLAVLFAAVAFPACFLWLGFGAILQRILRSDRAQRAFNVIMAVLLAASAVLFIV